MNDMHYSMFIVTDRHLAIVAYPRAENERCFYVIVYKTVRPPGLWNSFLGQNTRHGPYDTVFSATEAAQKLVGVTV